VQDGAGNSLDDTGNGPSTILQQPGWARQHAECPLPHADAWRNVPSTTWQRPTGARHHARRPRQHAECPLPHRDGV